MFITNASWPFLLAPIDKNYIFAPDKPREIFEVD
jgi:hypothetical protein